MRSWYVRLVVPCLLLAPLLAGCGPDCKDGKVASGGLCCWPNQTWSTEREACLGEPKCPAGLEARAGSCMEPAPKCPEGMIGIGATSFNIGTQDTRFCKKCPPIKEVKVAAFCIDRTEVTVEAYKQCVEAGKCSLSQDQANGCNHLLEDRMHHPANCLDWKQADAYCRFAGGRLPTEEEWQLAAGRVDGRRYPWGDAKPGAKVANLFGADGNHSRALHSEHDGWEFTAPVGSFTTDRSPFGLLDMGGNVSEWSATRIEGYPMVLGGTYVSAHSRELELRRKGTSDESQEGPMDGVRCARTPSP